MLKALTLTLWNCWNPAVRLEISKITLRLPSGARAATQGGMHEIEPQNALR
jgi:hypothetical protein